MNTELIELIETYIAKLSVTKAILYNQPKEKAQIIIKDLTGIDIEQLERQLNKSTL